MYHAESNTPAMARTSNLNEELGMVKYIFSDKTGTLTQNVMEFKRCSVGRHLYEAAAASGTGGTGDSDSDAGGPTLLQQHLANKQHPNAAAIDQFLTLLAVCHTVIPERTGPGEHEIVYHAASPDESALVAGARHYGYSFNARTPAYVEIQADGQRRRYRVLNVLEFSSDRKRMSVIVRNDREEILLFCKGADSVVYERLADRGTAVAEVTLRHLEEFATEGLRTLCCAMTVLHPEVYEEWRHLYQRASVALQNRDVRMAEVAQLIETNLTLLGATAIEDKLQVGVPETIAALIRADISVWVLTGDKQETAINIGYSCRLIDQSMDLIVLNEDSLDVSIGG